MECEESGLGLHEVQQNPHLYIGGKLPRGLTLHQHIYGGFFTKLVLPVSSTNSTMSFSGRSRQQCVIFCMAVAMFTDFVPDI
jgi:hypothetical protein